jgi:hypothetical protein
MRLARPATISTTLASAGAPRRRSIATCLEPSTSRNEKARTPNDHNGSAHDWIPASHAADKGCEPAGFAGTAIKRTGPTFSGAEAVTGWYETNAVTNGSSTRITSAAQLAA